MGAIITIHNISTVYIVQYMLSRSNTHVKLRHRTQCHEEQKQDLERQGSRFARYLLVFALFICTNPGRFHVSVSMYRFMWIYATSVGPASILFQGQFLRRSRWPASFGHGCLNTEGTTCICNLPVPGTDERIRYMDIGTN